MAARAAGWGAAFRAAAGAAAFSAGFGRPVLVWGTITAESLSAAIPTASPAHREYLARLEEHLQTLARVRYGRDEGLSSQALDAALDLGDDLSAALGREQGWIARGAARLRHLIRRRA